MIWCERCPAWSPSERGESSVQRISTICWSFCMQQTHYGHDLRRLHSQVAQPDQVVGSARKGEHPIHFEQPAMSYLPQQGNRLEPTETFLDSLPLPLADAVAYMTRRPPVDSTAAAPTVILCDMRRDLHVATFADEVGGVKAFVADHRHPLRTAQLLQH